MSEIARLEPMHEEPLPAAGFVEPRPMTAGAKQKPTRVVVLGEFNSGKTSLVNALLGRAVLPASFTRHTAYPTVVRFAPKPSLSAEIARRKRVPIAWDELDGIPSRHIYRLHVGVPLERLRALRAIDTPGLDGGDAGIEPRMLRACRSADAVIWCTPAMQAWKATEQQAWLALPKSTRARGILAVTFMDTLRSPDDARRLLVRLSADAGHLFRKIVAIPSHQSQPVLGASAAGSGS